MRKFLALLMALSMLVVAVFPTVAQDSNTIADIVIASAEAEEDAQFTVLLQAVLTSESITEALSDPEGEFTVFAPTDEAFLALLELLEITPEELLSEPEVVEAILLYHVVAGAVPAEVVVELDGEEVPTLLGDFAPVTIEITEDGDVTILDGTDLVELGVAEEDTFATVVTADVEADNGIIHVIDTVLIPTDEMLAEHFAMQPMGDDMMDEDMDDMGDEEDMGDMDEEGDMDDMGDEEDMGDMDEEGDMDDMMMSNTIADIVVASASAEEEAQFTVLLAAVSAADPAILEALSNPEAELTVFAPTDEAFVALLEALETDAETLLADTELLNTVLQYHVVEGAVMAETVMTLDGEAVPTLLGEDATISISVTDDGVVLNDSINVVMTDIEADNGVVHVIDGVLVPASDE